MTYERLHVGAIADFSPDLQAFGAIHKRSCVFFPSLKEKYRKKAEEEEEEATRTEGTTPADHLDHTRSS